MIQWIICKLCETPPVLPPLSSFIILMISRTKCEILKNSKKISFLCKKVSSKNVDIDSNFTVFDANSALFSQIEIILQILYEISRIFCGFYRFVPRVEAPLLSRNLLICLKFSGFVLDENVLTNISKFATFLKQDFKKIKNNRFSFRASEVG